jgi:tripartite-type tricarboxylate transporter receptor subunit TctC
MESRMIAEGNAGCQYELRRSIRGGIEMASCIVCDATIRIGKIGSIATIALFIGNGWSQAFPSKPIRLIVPFPAGGTTDIIARTLSAPLGRALGQNVIVDNRPGASGIIAAELLTRAAADGHTIFHGGSTFLITSVTRNNLPFDPLKDFTRIARHSANMYLFSVHPSLPVKSVNELIALARAKPGRLSYASSGVGSGQHLSAEMLKLAAKIDIVHVPYQGGAPSVVAAIGGQTEVLVTLFSEVMQPVAAGKLRALAVTGRTRAPQFPSVPTVAESGYADFELTSFGGVMGPAGMPKEVVNRLSAEFMRVTNLPEIREIMLQQGNVIAPLGPAEFDAFYRAEAQKLRNLVADAKIKLE